MKIVIIFFSLSFLFILSSCNYLKFFFKNEQIVSNQKMTPSQVNVKHMFDRQTYLVIGKAINDSDKRLAHSMVIVAYSDKFKPHERVDMMFFRRTGTHYGLTLPEGSYTLLIFSDKDENRIFDQSEVVGQREIILNKRTAPSKYMGNVDINLMEGKKIDWKESIEMPEIIERKESVFYPAGSLRTLDDPIFDEKVATIGMNYPSTFMDVVHTNFFALEEFSEQKIPVVFVHGIGGTPRAFKSIIERMDRNRYYPLLFYYPSGGDLDQWADIFYRVFLSGKIMPLKGMPMIVIAHSMGGIVVREALNKYKGISGELKVKLFVTIASPLGGHPSAVIGVEYAPKVLPVWRDLDPNNRFIKELYRKPLPEFVNHQLLFAYNNPKNVKLGENSDGSVPLSSQLRLEAQTQSQGQLGFNSGHTDILENEKMINYTLDKMNNVKNVFPESHLKLFRLGGCSLDSNDDYSPVFKYLMRTSGKYYISLVNGAIDPVHPVQEHLVRVVKGEIPATNNTEKSLLKFVKKYPNTFRSSPETSSTALQPKLIDNPCTVKLDFNNITTFRGDEKNTGFLPGNGPRFLQTILWEKTLKGKSLSPVVVGNTIYVAQEHGMITAMDKQTGSRFWEFKTKKQISHPPVIVNNTVLAIDDGGRIYSLNRFTGEKIWISDHDQGTEIPIAADERIAIFADDEAHVIGYNLKNGKKQWRIYIGTEVRYPISIKDGIFFVGSGNKLHAIETQTGKIQWVYKASDNIESAVAIGNGTLFFHNNDEHIIAIDRATGKEKWTFKPDGNLNTEIIIANNIIYFITNYPDNVYALDGTSSRVLWKREFKKGLDYDPVSVADLLYIIDDENKNYVLNRKTGKIISTFQLNKDASVRSAPFIDDGTLFIGTEDKKFYAIQ